MQLSFEVVAMIQVICHTTLCTHSQFEFHSKTLVSPTFACWGKRRGGRELWLLLGGRRKGGRVACGEEERVRVGGKFNCLWGGKRGGREL